MKFYIDEAHASGRRQLVAVYENGEPDFMAGIPDRWADENVQDFIFWPMKNPNSPFPAWEVPEKLRKNTGCAPRHRKSLHHARVRAMSSADAYTKRILKNQMFFELIPSALDALHALILAWPCMISRNSLRR